MTTVRWEEFGAERSEAGPELSRERDELDRDDRHVPRPFPTPRNEDAFYLSGRAEHVADPAAGTGLSATQLVTTPRPVAAFRAPPGS